MVDRTAKPTSRSVAKLTVDREKLVAQMAALTGRSNMVDGLRSKLLAMQEVIEKQVRKLATKEAKLQAKKRSLVEESRELGRRKAFYAQSLEQLMSECTRIQEELDALDDELRDRQEHPPAAPPRPTVPWPVAARRQAEQREQHGRLAPRLAVAVDVDLESENCFFAGMTENLSEGGLFVATYDTLPIGTLCDVTISLFDLPPISARCEVRWLRHEATSSDDYAPGMGVSFVDLAEEDRLTIAEFLQMREPFFIDGI